MRRIATAISICILLVSPTSANLPPADTMIVPMTVCERTVRFVLTRTIVYTEALGVLIPLEMVIKSAVVLTACRPHLLIIKRR